MRGKGNTARRRGELQLIRRWVQAGEEERKAKSAPPTYQLSRPDDELSVQLRSCRCTRFARSFFDCFLQLQVSGVRKMLSTTCVSSLISYTHIIGLQHLTSIVFSPGDEDNKGTAPPTYVNFLSLITLVPYPLFF